MFAGIQRSPGASRLGKGRVGGTCGSIYSSINVCQQEKRQAFDCSCEIELDLLGYIYYNQTRQNWSTIRGEGHAAICEIKICNPGDV